MQPLKANTHWKMKDVREEVKISTYLLLSDKLPKLTMFLVITTSPLTLPPHMAQVPASHAAHLYDANYHLVPLTMKKASQLTLHLLTEPCHHRTP